MDSCFSFDLPTGKVACQCGSLIQPGYHNIYVHKQSKRHARWVETGQITVINRDGTTPYHKYKDSHKKAMARWHERNRQKIISALSTPEE